MRAILLGAAAQSKKEERRLRSLWDEETQARQAHLLIGVDRGVEIFKSWGVTPHFAIGDWDSLASHHHRYLSGVPHVTLPRSKSRSDLFFAIQAALWAGADEIFCLGVTGGRPDHHLATLNELSLISSGSLGPIKQVIAEGPDARYYFLSHQIPHWEKRLKKGQIVSLFAMNQRVQGLSLNGFEYRLERAELMPNSQGLSNRVKNQTCSVTLEQGQLVIIIPSQSERG